MLSCFQFFAIAISLSTTLLLSVIFGVSSKVGCNTIFKTDCSKYELTTITVKNITIKLNTPCSVCTAYDVNTNCILYQPFENCTFIDTRLNIQNVNIQNGVCIFQLNPLITDKERYEYLNNTHIGDIVSVYKKKNGLFICSLNTDLSEKEIKKDTKDALLFLISISIFTFVLIVTIYYNILSYKFHTIVSKNVSLPKQQYYVRLKKIPNNTLYSNTNTQIKTGELILQCNRCSNIFNYNDIVYYNEKIYRIAFYKYLRSFSISKIDTEFYSKFWKCMSCHNKSTPDAYTVYKACDEDVSSNDIILVAS